MTAKKIPLYVWLALLCVVLLSAYSIHKRTRVESENRSVTIAAEFEVVEALAAGQQMRMESALADLNLQGLRGAVLNEESISELIATGRVALVGREAKDVGDRGLSLRVLDPSVLDRVRRGLLIRFGGPAADLEFSGGLLRLPPVSALQIRSTPIGLNPYQLEQVRAAGLVTIGRYANFSGLSGGAVSQTLDWASQQGVTVYLPLGDEVLGFRDSIDSTIRDLRRTGIEYASVEFGKIAGDTETVEKAKGLVIRMHSAQVAELDKLNPFDAEDRYVKAARERNMRILLVRPLSQSSSRPLEAYGSFLRDISRQLVKNGQALGPPHPYREPGLVRWFFPLLGLALTPVVWFVAACFVANPTVRRVGAVVLVVLALSAFTKIGQELMALLGSMAFPLLGFIALDQALPKLPKSEVVRAATGFWIVSGISLVGGVCVAGMLNSLAFYIHAAEFQAVKLSVFLPIVLVGIHYFFRLTDWKASLSSPMTWGKTALGLGLGLALAVMIARTGNDNGVGPSSGEMVFRSLLDRFLYVRPRTKEFLVGHPALVFGIGMLGRISGGKRGDSFAGWTVLALTAGAIGQTSVVNTLCHIHIPFFLSLIRDLEGMALGCIIGVMYWAGAKRWLPNGE